MYEIRIKKSAKKDLDALDDKTYIRIDRNIQSLINAPFPKGVKKLRGEGNQYRIREPHHNRHTVSPLADHTVVSPKVSRTRLGAMHRRCAYVRGLATYVMKREMGVENGKIR